MPPWRFYRQEKERHWYGHDLYSCKLEHMTEMEKTV